MNTNTNEKDVVTGQVDKEKILGAEAAPDEKLKGKPADAPAFGFDSDGYFFVRVHSGFGFSIILDHLEQARDVIKATRNQQIRNEEENNKIIKPGFRGFNPFKRKG